MADIAAQLIQEFKLKPFQVQNTIKLVDEGCTIPFIARYRKELTGELNDQVLRELYERLVYLRSLEERREDVRRLIDEQGFDKMIPERRQHGTGMDKQHNLSERRLEMSDEHI